MLVIIEGCDKCGKTTLAKHIQDTFGFEYLHCSQPGEKGAYREYIDLLNSIGSKNVVIDRFHIGEEVYGPIYRGKSGLSEGQFREIEAEINKKNGILIYCYDSDKNISKRFDEYGETFSKKQKIKEMLNLYFSALKKSKLIKYRHKMKSNKDLISNKEIYTIIKKFLFIEK